MIVLKQKVMKKDSADDRSIGVDLYIIIVAVEYY